VDWISGRKDTVSSCSWCSANDASMAASSQLGECWQLGFFLCGKNTDVEGGG